MANGKLFKHTAQTLREEIDFAALKNIPKLKAAGTAFNIWNAASSYKENREKGNTVLGSALKAGVGFAIMDTMNPALLMGTQLLQAAPSMVMKGVESYNAMSRQMNSMTRFQTFGEGNHFVDTNELATMRQSGMELAQQSQYNLQQAMMGNEAQYLHR